MLLHFTAIVPNDPKIMGTSSGQLVQRRPQQQPQGSWRLSVDWRLSCSLSNWRKWRRRNPKAAMPKTPTSNGLFNSRKNCFYFSRNLGLNLAKKEVDKGFRGETSQHPFLQVFHWLRTWDTIRSPRRFGSLWRRLRTDWWTSMSQLSTWTLD